MHDPVGDRGEGIPAERLPPREAFIEDHAEGEDVRAAVDAAPLHLLGGHVVRRSEKLARRGEVDGFGRDLRDAEVGDLHALVAGEDDVGWLDVAMDDPLAVREVERLGDLLEDPRDRRVRERLALLENLLERRTFDVLHRNEGDRLFVVLPDVVHGDDRGMAEDAGRLRFAHEPRLELADLLLVTGIGEADGLQSDEAADQGVAREVDDSHRPLAQLPNDLVTAEVHGCVTSPSDRPVFADGRARPREPGCRAAPECRVRPLES